MRPHAGVCHAHSTESLPQVPPRCRLTTRLYRQVGEGVAESYSCVSSAARAHGVSWPVAHAAFVAHVTPVLEQDLPEVTVLGIDETRCGKPIWETRSPAGGGSSTTGGTPPSSKRSAAPGCSPTSSVAPPPRSRTGFLLEPIRGGPESHMRPSTCPPHTRKRCATRCRTRFWWRISSTWSRWGTRCSRALPPVLGHGVGLRR